MVAALIFSIALAAVPASVSSVSESSVSVEEYEALYDKQRSPGEFPKAFIFSKDGRCVGVLAGSSTPAAALWDGVEAALDASATVCDVVPSAESPDAQLENAVGTGRPRVLLVTIREDFCRACAEYRSALVQGHEARQSIDVEVVSVSLPSGKSG